MNPNRPTRADTGAMLKLLERGPLTTTELRTRLGLNSRQVWGCLKTPQTRGIVDFVGRQWHLRAAHVIQSTPTGAWTVRNSGPLRAGTLAMPNDRQATPLDWQSSTLTVADVLQLLGNTAQVLASYRRLNEGAGFPFREPPDARRLVGTLGALLDRLGELQPHDTLIPAPVNV